MGDDGREMAKRWANNRMTPKWIALGPGLLDSWVAPAGQRRRRAVVVRVEQRNERTKGHHRLIIIIIFYP
jgi:hypothetical protein